MLANYTKGFARMASSWVLRSRVFDEEHLLNEIFTEFSSVEFLRRISLD